MLPLERITFKSILFSVSSAALSGWLSSFRWSTSAGFQRLYSSASVLRNIQDILSIQYITESTVTTERVLASIPNLRKLRVQIELTPGATEALRFCDDISNLQSLTSLQFVVVNPELKFETVAPALSFSFSRYIRKLTLSGFGYPWEDMYTIANLSNLENLKLKCYAFRGEQSVVKKWDFWMLKYLSIEDTDLMQWTGYFRGVEILTIKNCYRLLELPKLPDLKKIWLVDCNPSAVTCAKQMAPSDCSVSVDSSWLGDGKLS